jgi:formylglycine-generating enzyme required for sulfatase activity
MELSNGTDLNGGKYKIISKISQGNFGITYLAEQTNLERKVCIKEFFFRGSCERSGNGQITVTSSGKEVVHSFLRKFMREAKRLSKFDHPNIVKVIDVFEENGTAYMVMDYVDGETLQQLVDRKGKLTESEALGYILPLCDALEVVHEKGLLHLDIKPSNILVKKHSNSPVLIDFGISKFTEASGVDHSTTAPVALTKGYAPLEQYSQDLSNLTAITDVYAVAATLYKLVTGVTPPEAVIIVNVGIKSPIELNPAISEKLSSIILKSLSKGSIDRAQSINKLKKELLGINQLEVVKEVEAVTEVLSKRTEPNPSQTNPIPVAKSTTILIPTPKTENKNSVVMMLLAVAVIALLLYVAKDYKSVSNSSSEVNRATVANPKDLIAETEKPTKQETIQVKQNPIFKDKKQTKQETPPTRETVQKSYKETIDEIYSGMIPIKGGNFQMGSNEYDDEKPIHSVTISDFSISKTEVTQAQWETVMITNPSYFKGDNLPVENVSWDDVQVFLVKLNAKTGKNYRLPTEAEWEYATGGGENNRTKFAGTNSESSLGNYAWYDANSGDKTHPVGSKQPNQLGLYDMSGNVCEWCNNWYGQKYYAHSPQNNPKGDSSYGSNRVYRGGSWGNAAKSCRVAYRFDYAPGYRNSYLGFRLVLVP